MPGLRFHSENYLSIDNSKSNKRYILTSSPKYLFNKKNFIYFFIPMPFKIISRIFKLKTFPLFKLIDSMIYQIISFFFILFINPKVIHVWGGYGFLLFLIFKNKKLIIERSSSYDEIQHSIIQFEKKRLGLIMAVIDKKKSFLLRSLEYKSADMIITSSEYTKKTFPIKYQNKIKIIYPFSNKILNYCYKKTHKSIFIIGYIGGNIIVKGLDYLLSIIDDINFKFELHLKINKTDLINFPTIKQKILNKSYIKLIPTSNDMDSFYQSLDMVIQPSIDDGFSMVTIEALSCGIPVYSSLNNGSSEFLKEILPNNVFDINDPTYLRNLFNTINKTDLLKQSKTINKNFNYVLHEFNNYNKEAFDNI